MNEDRRAPQALDRPPGTAGIAAPQRDLAQVWGDVVDLRELRLAIPIGAAISLGAYLGAVALFRGFVEDPAMARAYGMLVGIAGCILSGAVCAVLFQPKRIVREEIEDTAWHEAVIDQLAAERGGIGLLEDLPPAAERELKELGLYELFAARSRAEAQEPSRGGM
ncbi:hypothetical protein [Aureimonas mangrovi]|uniref:hypothetical protein n=1 Tax=Aureimonas mangrovi TaxID=2758041 RepID=UPI001AEF2CF3|nr:hypothetical protein [Aureimonas mangrovi]